MLGRRLNPQERPPTKQAEDSRDAAEALQAAPGPSRQWQEALDTLAARRYALPTAPSPAQRLPAA
jgi:hypothetical protein